MPQSLASRSDSLALAAAMSRHPAAGVRATVSALPGAAQGGSSATRSAGGAASFTTVAALLTGPWRVNDPVSFAAAMRAAPLVAGYPVVDLCACARQPTVQLDPLSAAVAGHLESAVEAAATRSGLTVRWVAAPGGSQLFVETAARVPADGEGPELLVLAHLVEPIGRRPADDDSWVVVVVGDGRGGVAGIGRAALDSASRPPFRLRLDLLRARLVGPARAGEGLGPSPFAQPLEAVVLPFRR